MARRVRSRIPSQRCPARRWHRCGVIVLLALPFGPSVSAHRVDEYLQVAQVSIAAERVELGLYLTPGIAVVPTVLAAIDQSGDGQVSPDEVRAYAAAVVGQMSVELDGAAIPLALEDVDYPDGELLATGRGAIHVRAAAQVERPAVGEHGLVFRNGLQAPQSLYQANAMLPDDSTVRILGQERDADQTRLTIRYRITPGAPAWPGAPFAIWTAGGIAGVALVGLWFRRTTMRVAEPRDA